SPPGARHPGGRMGPAGAPRGILCIVPCGGDVVRSLGGTALFGDATLFLLSVDARRSLCAVPARCSKFARRVGRDARSARALRPRPSLLLDAGTDLSSQLPAKWPLLRRPSLVALFLSRDVDAVGQHGAALSGGACATPRQIASAALLRHSRFGEIANLGKSGIAAHDRRWNTSHACPDGREQVCGPAARHPVLGALDPHAQQHQVLILRTIWVVRALLDRP